ncbi:inositol polyphosphate phosphatase-like 1b isoform X2 [Paramormyrops kingsleyae]|uniref:inositol polyphosphate phosphatase-like 1b isoform X2 n=1 Tax=Paramormyrops kingsleyae TaxID=1676925 RepID=UPI003B96DCBF
MATPAWYHRDISRVQAEELLARAGQDGSFLVRNSESVAEAYALCLLFQRHVHTYRILPDADGLLAVQTSQGVQVNCFRTLGDLVLGYQQPHKGLVTPLLYPVGQEAELGDESSDGEDERLGVTSSGWSPGPAPPMAPPPGLTMSPGSHLFFLHRLQELSSQSVASDMVALFSEYLRTELPQDMDSLRRGGTSLHSLQRILGSTCEGLRSEIDLTLSSLETLARVFDHPTCPLLSPKSQNTGKLSDQGLDSLVCKISALCSLLSSLEKRVLKALQDAVANHNLAVQPAPPPETAMVAKPWARPVPVCSFQVKVSHSGRQLLSIDVDNGVLLFDRKSGAFGVETVSHDRILKLMRFHTNPGKLCMVVDSHTHPPREILFESEKKCEAFWQLLQLLKARRAPHSHPDAISVFVGTWNMGGSPSPRSLLSWVKCCGLGNVPDETTRTLPHDIYAFGTQENPQGERDWVEHLRTVLRAATHIDFKLVAVQSLWSIRLAVFVRPEHEKRVSHVSVASVKTGLGNTLGHKGAVGVSFLFSGTSLGFVNCHLSSGSEKTVRRNQNFQDILRLLSLGDWQPSPFDVSLRFTHLFWCGDLNYRLDLEVQDILKHVCKREFEALMCADQLTRERHKRKVFLHFSKRPCLTSVPCSHKCDSLDHCTTHRPEQAWSSQLLSLPSLLLLSNLSSIFFTDEEKILFPPTYRYERGSRECYQWEKYKTSGVRVNVPSWCDRVLWKSYPQTHLVCTAYGCTDDITTSDHSPVFATFQVGVASPIISKPDTGPSERAYIELEGVEVIVKTASKAKFSLEFHSNCLEEFRRSSENDSQICEVPGFLKLGWSSRQLPKLFPVISDMEHLQDQHLLLSVKSCDGLESYGECCVALRSLLSSTAEAFETFLTHRGEEMGSLRGRLRVHVPKDRRQRRERTYEWFCFEKDESSLARGSPSHPVTGGPSARSPAGPSTPVPAQPAQAPSASVPSSYTNPAYFIFEGMPIQRFATEDPTPKRDPRVVWARDSVLQLPKVSPNQSQQGKSTRRSDFTEIEIPGCLPHCRPSGEAPSSYQLFPAQDRGSGNPSSRLSLNSTPHSPERFPYRDDVVLQPRSPAVQRNLYWNRSAVAREMPWAYRNLPRKTSPRLSLDPPSGMHKTPALYPYSSTRVPHREAASWAVGPQPDPPGDHSLTALQIAKSLSEMDFLPVDHKIPTAIPRAQQRNLGYELSTVSEKEAPVLRVAPGSVWELLSSLGLQRYTLGLSLNGWDDLLYFSEITEQDLRAAGVTNPAHRRRILENLPRIWE